MKEAKFYVSNSFEGEDNCLPETFTVTVSLTDEEFEELYQVWYAQDQHLNSWEDDWREEHEALYTKINETACPFFLEVAGAYLLDYDELGILWQISHETENAF